MLISPALDVNYHFRVNLNRINLNLINRNCVFKTKVHTETNLNMLNSYAGTFEW